MKKIIRLTERDLTRIVRRVINETNRIDETSLINRFQYYKEIKQAKESASESGECFCVVKPIVGQSVVKPCSELTRTEEDHIIYQTEDCDTWDGMY